MSEDQPTTSGGSSRPTGKRQLAGVSTTSTSSSEANKVSAPTKNTESGQKFGGSVVRFLPEVVTEVRKVIWPTARQMVIYTTVVLVFLIVLTALVSGVDFLAGTGVEKILTP